MNPPNRPARFLLKNSKGHPDFVMTMLVAFSVALFLLLLFWVMINLIGLLNVLTVDAQGNGTLVEFIKSFNSNLQLVVIGLSSSVFGLAGTYYMRRKSYDEHYLEKQKTWHSMGSIVDAEGFIDKAKSTLQHPNYDDEEEDI